MDKFISDGGDWFTFLGFVFSILTFLGILFNKSILKKINKKSFSINRMPENLIDLKTISRNISIFNSEFDSKKPEILIEINKLSPILKSLKKSLNKADLEHFNSLSAEIKKVSKIYYEESKVNRMRKFIGNYIILNEDFVDKIYRFLTVLITDIENISNDNQQNLI
ncbi:hypothetical protein [Flavobacterium ardleyense]|uniref:hypothetical protein n=1 Tax=Flavobacterium ardleyense TaxID=2038737 RepID=UPI00298CD696|nr:hypothetical protein [Flavobacterium ardleyense]